jgi:hypothetical protein
VGDTWRASSITLFVRATLGRRPSKPLDRPCVVAIKSSTAHTDSTAHLLQCQNVTDQRAATSDVAIAKTASFAAPGE